ncbi:hypothetical protein QVD17_09335 [Tagetes erecta]|uniref:Cytochrome P450 n=1 Tax=Tagetes erecta TaxID=13708 RepID=A0AAD8P4Z3_TARER|nr:hypothetical protein QVD17_09335 [Tagetes erecta]
MHRYMGFGLVLRVKSKDNKLGGDSGPRGSKRERKTVVASRRRSAPHEDDEECLHGFTSPLTSPSSTSRSRGAILVYDIIVTTLPPHLHNHSLHPYGTKSTYKVAFSLYALYAMGRMETIWGKDSCEFKPERWITDKNTIRHEPSYKFLSFNTGPRICVGKQVAFTQLKAVGATILHNYNFEMTEGHIVTPNVSIILYMKHGLKVKVTPRRP